MHHWYLAQSLRRWLTTFALLVQGLSQTRCEAFVSIINRVRYPVDILRGKGNSVWRNKLFINFYVALKCARWRLAFNPDFRLPEKSVQKNIVVLGGKLGRWSWHISVSTLSRTDASLSIEGPIAWHTEKDAQSSGSNLEALLSLG